MIHIKLCPLCKSDDLSMYIKSKDFSTSKEEFEVSICNKCSFLFTNPRPEEKDIGEYYKSENYLSHTNKKKGLFNILYQAVRNITIKSKTNLLISKTNTKSHLDIGCGTGEFLNSCEKKGIKTVGIEPSDIAKKSY